MAAYRHSLDLAYRDAGTVLGDDHRFIDKLLAGKPVTVGMLGASVAQNAGCLTQPGERCMNYNGVTKVGLVHGEPRERPFKGWLVRWFEWLNATWPHADHSLENHGLDAQPIHSSLPCIYAYVPPKVDLVFIEAGSIPYHFDVTRTEAVLRRLGSLEPRPTIVFVTVTIWCKCQPVCRAMPGWRHLPTFSRQTLLNATERPIPHVEGNIARLCARYNLSCLSMRDALTEPVFASTPGFSIPEVAGDCLHPISGSRGVDYVTDLVIHWTQKAVEQRRDAALRVHPATTAVAPAALPSAINVAAARLKENPGACFNLAHLGTSRGVMQRRLTVAWHTAFCPRTGAANGTCAASLSDCAAADAARAGCTHWDDQPSQACWPSASAAAVVQRPPTVWWFCGYALSASHKQSPGVVALVPGAQLYLPLDAPFARGTTGSVVLISLLHLRSYEGMGVAHLRCVAGCWCSEHRIDAHRPARPSMRNESVFKEFSFKADFERGDTKCLLSLRLSAETSSGGHKFKVRSLTARQASKCETREAPDVMCS